MTSAKEMQAARIELLACMRIAEEQGAVEKSHQPIRFILEAVKEYLYAEEAVNDTCDTCDTCGADMGMHEETCPRRGSSVRNGVS